MIDRFESEKQQLVTSLRQSVNLCSRNYDKPREKWIVYVLLKCLGVDVKKTELEVDEQASIVDVFFRDAAFQVKEHQDVGRRRTLEHKKNLEKISAANTTQDIIDYYSHLIYEQEYPSIVDVVDGLRPLISEVSRSYAPSSRSITDLLIYVNLMKLCGVSGEQVPLIDSHGWRSISITKGGWGAVLYTADSAPEFLRTARGKVWISSEIIPELEEFQIYT